MFCWSRVSKRIFPSFSVYRSCVFICLVGKQCRGEKATRFPLEIQMMVFFLHRCDEIYLQYKFLPLFFHQSLWHNWTNSTAAFDFIYRAFDASIHRSVYHYRKMKNGIGIAFVPSAFYLFDFQFHTNCKSSFVFMPFSWSISVAVWWVSIFFSYSLLFVYVWNKFETVACVRECVCLFVVNRQIRIGKGVYENGNNK